MNWFDVMDAIHTHLESDASVDVPLAAGALVPVPRAAEVRLIRGPFQPRTNAPDSTDELTVFIECWVHDDKDADAKVGYQKLADLEDRVMQSVNQFGQGNRRINGKQIRIRPGRAEPDGDLFRPMLGSRTAVAITWR